SPAFKGEDIVSIVHEPINDDRIDATCFLQALTSLKKGDFSVRLPVEWTGVQGKVADTFNEVIEMLDRMVHELADVSRVVGKEGKLKERASLGDVPGAWQDGVSSVNTLIDDLV